MKKEYEAPELQIMWFETEEDVAFYSRTTDFIPDTDADDWFD